MWLRIPILAMVAAIGAAPAEMLPGISIQHISARMAETKSAESAEVRNYTVLRHYTLSTSHSGHVAEMMVRMTYTYPGHKSFEVMWERGSNVVQKRVFHRLLNAEEDASHFNTRVTAENYDFRLQGTETVEGRRCYVLQLTPKSKGKYLIRGKAWVDAKDFAVVKVEGEPVDDGSFWIRNSHIVQQYKKIGRFWMPAVNRADSEVRLFGQAHLTIENLDYQIGDAGDEDSRAEALRRRPPVE
jgi:outer membrane lipoprotein-sorting protein